MKSEKVQWYVRDKEGVEDSMEIDESLDTNPCKAFVLGAGATDDDFSNFISTSSEILQITKIEGAPPFRKVVLDMGKLAAAKGEAQGATKGEGQGKKNAREVETKATEGKDTGKAKPTRETQGAKKKQTKKPKRDCTHRLLVLEDQAEEEPGSEATESEDTESEEETSSEEESEPEEKPGKKGTKPAKEEKEAFVDADFAKDVLHDALREFIKEYIAASTAVSRKATESLQAAFLTSCKVENAICKKCVKGRGFKDAMECAVDGLLQVFPVPHHEEEHRYCEGRLDLRNERKVETFIPRISVSGHRSMNSALEFHQRAEPMKQLPKYAVAECDMVRKHTLKWADDQTTLILNLKNDFGNDGLSSMLSKTIKFAGETLDLVAFVKFTGETGTTQHYIVGLRGRDGKQWVELDDSVRRDHTSLQDIKTKTAGRRFVAAMYARKGYQPKLQHFAGIPNIGNTCYFNAGLQFLLRSNTFFDQIVA